MLRSRARLWSAKHLRSVADRISPETAMRAVGWRFRFVRNEGIRFEQDPAPGCPVWYYGPDYWRAHDYLANENRP